MTGTRMLGRLSLVLALLLTVCLCLFGPNLTLASEGGGHAETETHAAGADHDAHAGAGHGGVSSAKVWDLIFRIQNFVAAVIILYFILRKPIRQFFGNRRQEIEDTLSELEKKKAETERQYAEMEQKLKDMESQRETILADYVRDGEAEKEKIIQNAKTMSSRIQEQAERAIQQEIQKAKSELKREIAEMSATMAEDLVKSNINDQDQQRLVEEYLTKVVEN